MEVTKFQCLEVIFCCFLFCLVGLMEAVSELSLLELHAEAIKKLRDSVSEDGGPCYEDAHLLRYILSDPGQLSTQVTKLRDAVRYREENASWLEGARSDKSGATLPPYHDELKDIFPTFTHKTARNGSIVHYSKSGESMRMLKKVKVDDLSTKFIHWSIFIKEVTSRVTIPFRVSQRTSKPFRIPTC